MTASDSSDQHSHKVLLAGSLAGYSHSAEPVLEQLHIDFIHAQNAQQVLTAIQPGPPPFSIVICDDPIPGMDSITLLSQIKANFPRTLCFLVSDRFTPDLLAKAVNQAKVCLCIQAPFEPETLLESIQQGLAEYEHDLVRRRMFHQARGQNGKLYELNCELIEETKSFEKEINQLELEVQKLKAQLKNKTLKRPLSPKKLVALISQYLEKNADDPGPVLAQLHEQVILSIYTDFSGFAMENGIELPEPLELAAIVSGQKVAFETDAAHALETDKGDEDA